MIIKISACRNVWILVDNDPIVITNGLTLIADNSDKRIDEVVDALIEYPFLTKCSDSGNPSQPVPKILIVLIGLPYYDFKCIILAIKFFSWL